ncbi:hypothetical protein [Enterococcus gallinarum]|uniref:hypothetical protein n=1 Tax=Enterococcus gallinarum TaxID=1353 RepID=UPI000DEB517B|nr:hypothetical protein [Enterococcus gallinarum]RBT37408.1 hypothetical protein EB54_03139 [Enterococcus gallinarum]
MSTKITTTIEAETVSEYEEVVKALYGQVVHEGQQVPHKAKGATTEVPEKQEKQVEKKASKSKKEDKKLAEKKQADSTDLTSDTEPSTTGEVQEPTEKVGQEEPEKSITSGQHPGATKADVQAAMKNAMAKKKRDAILTAFGRFNAGKLSDLKEEDYSAFITDLEALVGE